MERDRQVRLWSGSVHALVHVGLWLSGTTLVVFGIKETPTIHLIGAVVNAIISLGLGIYGWGPFQRQSNSQSDPSV